VRGRFVAVFMLAVLAACGGSRLTPGGGGGGATPTPPPSNSQTATLGNAEALVGFSPIASGISGSVRFPVTDSGTATGTFTLQTSVPSGDPTPDARRVASLRANVLGGPATTLVYVTLSLNASVTISSTPSFTMTFPTGTLNGFGYVAFFDPANPGAGWKALLGPVTAAGTRMGFAARGMAPLTLQANTLYVFAIVQSASALPTPTPGVSPTPGGCVQSNGGSPAGWGPNGVTGAYNFPFASGGRIYNGKNQTVAVVIDSNVNPNDVNAYLAHYNVSPIAAVTDEPIDGSGTDCISNEQREATLDVETIAGLAPAAKIVIYQVPALTDQDIADAYNQIISDGQAFVVNSSIGGCEGTATPPESPVIASGAAKGIAFVSSAGDLGNVCSGPSQVGASYPASDPNGIGVGGTETASVLISNVLWNDKTCGTGQQCGGGGGISTLFGIPPYQSSPGSILSTCSGGAQPQSGAPCSTSHRNVPDVSMPAEDVSVYEGGWIQLNGTSWASPEYAALMADLYDYCGVTQGIANPVKIPYYVAENNYANAFIDVTGSNTGFSGDQYGSTTPYYVPNTGFDAASGWGVPKDGGIFSNTACPGGIPVSGGVLVTPRSGSAMRHAGAFEVDATPRVGGLTDLGERSRSDTVRVQFVLFDSPSVASDEAQLVAALQRDGFAIEKRYANHLVVDAQASSGTVERYFATRMHNVVQGAFGVRYTPVAGVTVPPDIAPYVQVVNMDDVVTRHVLSSPVTR
jgi:hypothetical protein